MGAKSTETKVAVVVCSGGVCLKLYVGQIEVSVVLESDTGELPKEFIGKRFGYKTEMGIYKNPDQEVPGYDNDNITSEFACTEDTFLYSVTADDIFYALLFARLKAKRLEAKEESDKYKRSISGSEPEEDSNEEEIEFCECPDLLDGQEDTVDDSGDCNFCGKPVREEDVELFHD